MSTENENTILETAFSEAVNLFVRQKGGKKGIVTKVDRDNLTCNIEPDDKSAPIEEAVLASANGIIPIPVVGSSVSVVAMHLDGEQDGEYMVIEVTEIDSYYINAQKTVVIQSSTIKIGSNDASKGVLLGDALIAKLDELVAAINGHSHPDKLLPPAPFIAANFSDTKSNKVFVE